MAIFLLLFAERVYAVNSSSASFAGVGCIKDVAVLEVNSERIASLNFKRANQQTDRRLSRHIIK